MITCGSCGTQNELGRVFCVQCGGKLDLTAMTSEAVAESVKQSFIQKHWPKFVIGVVVIIVAVFGLTFVPSKGIQTKQGTLVGASRVRSNLRNMTRMSKGMIRAFPFREDDINSYFQVGDGKDLGLGTVVVALSDDVMRVHITTTAFTLPLGKYKWSPGTTYDLYCKGMGGYLMVVKAKKGLLPVGKRGVQKKLHKALAGAKVNVLDSFEKASEIKIEKDRVLVTVSNK